MKEIFCKKSISFWNNEVSMVKESPCIRSGVRWAKQEWCPAPGYPYHFRVFLIWFRGKKISWSCGMIGNSLCNNVRKTDTILLETETRILCITLSHYARFGSTDKWNKPTSVKIPHEKKTAQKQKVKPQLAVDKHHQLIPGHNHLRIIIV